MMPNLARCSSPPDSIQVKPKKRRLLVKMAWVLLLAWIQPLTASAGSTFPDKPGQRAEEPVGPVEPRDAAPPQPAYPNREDIEADIQALEAERANLLTKYASAHPDVRAVERRLQVRRKQVEMLNQTASVPR